VILKEQSEHRSHYIEVIVRSLWAVISLVLFIAYFSTAILRFWLWFFCVIFALLAIGVHLATLPLSVLSGARPLRLNAKAESAKTINVKTAPTGDLSIIPVKLIPAKAHDKGNFSWPLKRLLQPVPQALQSFWRYNIERKVIALLMSMALVVLPGMFIVPRPHTVQILDNNSLNYADFKIGQSNAGYVVHAVDFDDPEITHEYINENIWWLAKLNSQGLKANLRPGRYYRLWVVGVRWWLSPALYPNIIAATELDSKGNVLSEPSKFVPATTTGK
jgi:hypothetical protein